ncbi:uncharacterized protein [Arachis hypogaea]|uniref:uncharacterized protein n=1 Tax=Arachis hypogaea TaxID=3818 RepID=UPI003B21CB6C
MATPLQDITDIPLNNTLYQILTITPELVQVAAIIVGDDVETMIRGRDIKICPDDHFTVLQAGRLLQQYVVDNYLKIETGKLRRVRTRQKKLRAELYQGLQDALHTGETNVENVVRKRTILPSSFIGSRRDMTQRYEDGMAIVLKEEIPSKEVEPHLHDAVLKHMIHGPCGTLDQSSPCMKMANVNATTQKSSQQKHEEVTTHIRNIGDDSTLQYRLTKISQLTIDGSIKSIKYLYKYCYKGPDRVAMEVHNGSNVDEVQQFVDARWIAAPEALERLQIHLPNQHQVSFYDHQTIPEILNDDYFSRTMLTEFFVLNREEDQQFRHLLYRKIPEGPISWDDLLTVNGVQYSSFKQSAQHRGLLESDSSIHACLVEASVLRLPCALQRLFATILIFREPTDVRSLWDEFFLYMVDDYPSTSTTTLVFTNRLLRDINDIILQHRKQITQYDLPALTHKNDNDNLIPRVIQEELSVKVPREDLCSVARLNNDQSKAFKCIMNTIDRRESGVFFVDGPGGSGKIFLYRAIIAELRNKGHIILITASSGIAATLLPGGRTAHSRFKIPINVEPSSICNISKQSNLAKLIRQTTAIIWDEAPMTNKESVQSLDRTLRDILANDMPFGGKVMVMGGDFRQYLMRIGDGIEPTIHEDFVRIQANMAIPWEGETSLHKLIEEIFPNVQSHGEDASYMVERAILTPKNHDVQQLNDIIIN